MDGTTFYYQRKCLTEPKKIRKIREKIEKKIEKKQRKKQKRTREKNREKIEGSKKNGALLPPMAK